MVLHTEMLTQQHDSDESNQLFTWSEVRGRVQSARAKNAGKGQAEVGCRARNTLSGIKAGPKTGKHIRLVY